MVNEMTNETVTFRYTEYVSIQQSNTTVGWGFSYVRQTQVSRFSMRSPNGMGGGGLGVGILGGLRFVVLKQF